MATPIYNCTQQELYTIAETATNSLEQHLSDFGNFKPKYDTTFVASLKSQITATRNLPDNQARNSVAETARVELIDLNTGVLNKFQALKRYIVDAFPPSQHKIQFNAAGQPFYSKAVQLNWDSTKGLLSSALLYITNNTVKLTADQNMPVTFENDFFSIKAAFEAKHQEFFQAEEDAHIQTQAKINANNLLYNTVVKFCLDGQEIYKKDEAVRKQFVIADLLLLASGPGVAGFKGKVTNAITGQPIQGVEVAIQYSDKMVTTDEEGKYAITQVASGNYTVIVSKNAYDTQTIQQQVIVGTVSTLNIQLVPAN
jgi:hypothetical protein